MDNSRENLKSFDTSYTPYYTWLIQGNYIGRYVARNTIVKKTVDIFVEKNASKKEFRKYKYKYININI